VTLPAAPPVLAVRHGQKRFGAVHALKDVSIEAYRGEVLALLGDNGAGKSTRYASMLTSFSACTAPNRFCP